MKKFNLKYLLSILSALSVFVLISCLTDEEKDAGRGSEVENELGVYGKLVDEGGKPVSGAKVKAVKFNSGLLKAGSSRGTSADSDSVFTDTSGKYSFRKLAKAEYNLYGDYNSGSLVVLIPGVSAPDSTIGLNVGIDTLRVPGRIRGRVLVGDKGKSAVLCYIGGTSYLSISDDSGRFVLSGLPQGRYSVSYSTPGFLVANDSGINVYSRKTTEMPDKHLAYDPSLPPPAPLGLRAEYDTLSEIVTLHWDAVPVSDLEGYVIYRDVQAFLDPKPIGDGFTKETSTIDNTLGFLSPQERKTLVYRVKARDLEANVSISYSTPATINVVSRSYATTTFTTSVIGAQGDTLSIKDTIRLIVNFSNPTRKTKTISWKTNEGFSSLQIHNFSTLSGSDTLVWVGVRAGQFFFTVNALDDAGLVWNTNIPITVLQDAPQVNAGSDTTVSIGDEIQLKGMASDKFGKVSLMAWDIGNTGEFKSTVTGNYSAVAPKSAGNLLCIFKAIDDDGNISFVTTVVNVIADLPIINLGPDRVGSIGDTLDFHGIGSDQFGRIVKWEWDIGGTGNFQNMLANISVKMPTTPRDYFPCILRVTDDDGNKVSDTLIVTVLLDAPSVNLGKDLTLSSGALIPLNGFITNSFGKIVKFEWSFGGGSFIDASRPDTIISTPQTQNLNYQIILRVTDDDGNIAQDTLMAVVEKIGLIAVGESGLVYTSPDNGLSWVKRITPTNNSLQSIAWSGTQLVAVGNLGDILTSKDGINWVKQIATGATLKSVIWAGNLFVASGSKIYDTLSTYTSPDGINWTSHKEGNARSITSMVWTGSQIIAAGEQTIRKINNGCILSFASRQFWEPKFQGTSTLISTLGWSGNKLVAVGNQNPGVVLTSPDGLSWTLGSTPTANDSTNSIASSGNLFVAVGESFDGTNFVGSISTSPDGITWTSQTPGPLKSKGRSVIWTGKQFLAVGDQGSTFISTDGILWKDMPNISTLRLNSVISLVP